MANDHFSELWAKMKMGPEDELAVLVKEFYDAGRIQAETEIRQALIAEAERVKLIDPEVYPPALALRTFAAGLALNKGGE